MLKKLGIKKNALKTNNLYKITQGIFKINKKL